MAKVSELGPAKVRGPVRRHHGGQANWIWKGEESPKIVGPGSEKVSQGNPFDRPYPRPEEAVRVLSLAAHVARRASFEFTRVLTPIGFSFLPNSRSGNPFRRQAAKTDDQRMRAATVRLRATAEGRAM